MATMIKLTGIKNLPDWLKDYPEDGNPVVAVYHFK